MMADATEAASKSLTDHSREAICDLVNKIIDGQIANGLLKEAPISFRDVEIIKNTFIERLGTFYHMRVKYPDQIKKKSAEEKAEQPAENTEVPAETIEVKPEPQEAKQPEEKKD